MLILSVGGKSLLDCWMSLEQGGVIDISEGVGVLSVFLFRQRWHCAVLGCLTFDVFDSQCLACFTRRAYHRKYIGSLCISVAVHETKNRSTSNVDSCLAWKKVYRGACTQKKMPTAHVAYWILA